MIFRRHKMMEKKKLALTMTLITLAAVTFSCILIQLFTPDTSPLPGPDYGEREEGRRGLCYNALNAAEVEALSGSQVRWLYNWHYECSPEEDAMFMEADLDYVPMAWGAQWDEEAMRAYYGRHPGARYLLGYNEPNMGEDFGGCFMTPAEAARDWERLERVAEDFGLELVSPALTYSGVTLRDGKLYSSPREWMDAFIEEYKALHGGRAPRYDYLAIHSYMNWPQAVEGFCREYYGIYGKRIWLTEFCAWEFDNGPQIESMRAQTDSMKEKLLFLDRWEGIFRYSWFMSHGATDTVPYNSVFVRKGGDGTLTSLGKEYLGWTGED